MAVSTVATTPSVRKDASAGALAGLMSLPAGLAYGVLVFGPLGPEAASRGVVAGLVTMALLNIVSAFFRGAPTLICSPTSLPTLVLSSAVVGYMKAGLGTSEVFSLIASAALLAGLLQLGIGVSGLGDLVKFVPFPVRSGLLTGTAILMLDSQIPAVLGTANDASLLNVSPGAIAVAALTIITMWVTRRLSPRFPAALAGVAVGTAAHFLLAVFLGGALMGSLVGHIPSAMPTPEALKGVAHIWSTGEFGTQLGRVLPLAIGLAVVASMDTLVAVLASESVSDTRTNNARELMAQGTGNIVAAIFGGFMGAASASRSVANYSYGARSTLSRAVAGAFALLVLLVIAPWVGQIPIAVLGGLLSVLAFDLFDRWILKSSANLLRGHSKNRTLAASNLTIAIAVIVTMLSFGVIQAVGLGMLLSVLYFVTRMGKRVVRREYDGSALHSNIQRGSEEFSLLEKQGQRIKVLEVEGSLFFATADRLGLRLESLCSNSTSFIIADLRLVAELDITGAEILKTTHRRCQNRGVTLLLCYSEDTAVARHMHNLGVAHEVGAEHCFSNVNDALGHAEDRLLDGLLSVDRYSRHQELETFAALCELDAAEFSQLRQLTQQRIFSDGEVIFTQASAADAMFFLNSGRARIITRLAQSEGEASVATLCPGTLLGELALIDKRPRSASAVADGQVVCLELRDEEFSRLLSDHPRSAVKLLSGVAREIATRVRIANRTVR